MVGCCTYKKTSFAEGARVFIIDRPVNQGAVKRKLEDEGFSSRMSGDLDLWEKNGLEQKVRRLDRMYVVFLEEDGYLLMGSPEGVNETMYRLDTSERTAGSNPLEQVIARLGDGWKDTGRLDAQTDNNANAHCAYSSFYSSNCEATAYYTSYDHNPLETSIVSLYRTWDQALMEIEATEYNLESSGIFTDVEVSVAKTFVDERFTEATVIHKKALQRNYTTLY